MLWIPPFGAYFDITLVRWTLFKQLEQFGMVLLTLIVHLGHDAL